MIAAALLTALLLTGCDQTPVDTGTPIIPSGPVLEHTPTDASVREGDELPVAVVATDPDGVSAVTLYYRAWGDPVWEPLDLVAEGDSWSGIVPSASIRPPAVEYYLKGTDGSDNELVSYLPTGGQGEPFQVDVGEVGRPVPYLEDFEGLDGAGQVYDLGWFEFSQSFQGYAWTVREDRAYSGSLAAAHRRGVEGLDELHDWLVSPPLDLSSMADLQVSWFEWGDYVDSADHALWISLGSPDPDDGDYELVAELEPPAEDEWGRAPAVDLSAWAGEELAYLAWVYRGQYADAWYLDDIHVRALGPDLDLVESSFSTVDPGGTTTLTLTLSNRMDVAATGVELSVEVDEAAATVASLPAPFDVGGLAQESVGVQLQIDASHPDNAYLPLEVVATDGTDTWTWDQVLVVGDVSTGHVSLTLAEDPTAEGGLVELTVGAGDPDDPLVSLPFAADYLEDGDWEWTVDLTDLYAHLPPAPGEQRWWLRVSSTLAGELSRFAIEYDAVVAESDDLGAFLADEATTFYLPRPPSPELLAAATDPGQVAPGDSVTWTVTLSNEGASTVGLTTVTLTSDDDDVTLVDAGPFTLATTGWAEGESAELVVSFSVSEGKVDSRPAELTLEVVDEAETFEVEGEVDVPWPVLALTALRVDDWSDGDNDGLLDPDETAKLEFELTNAGDLDTFGAVYCTMAITGGSATATLLDDTNAYGLLSAGETDEKDFEIAVTAGSVGDDIDLSLDCTDGTQDYALIAEVILGERPWIALSPVDDDDDDAVDEYQFDIVNGRYRSDGTTLEVELYSAEAYDPSTLFLEFWGVSTGAGYTYYQVVFQSGVGKLRGYDAGKFTELDTPTLTEVDETTVLLDLDIPSMDLTLDKLSMGFASGFCGGDDYYCDHFPDSWGNPYQSGMTTSRFVDMSW